MSYFPGVRPLWLTWEDLCRDARLLAKKLLSRKIRGVVGIARSGIAPAAVVACHIHAPLYIYSPETGRTTRVGGGARTRNQRWSGDLILVDDTTASFATMHAAMEATGISLGAVVYASQTTQDRVIAGRVLALPHLLEWNFWNSIYMPEVAVDLDGLICADPTPADVATRRAYEKWMATAPAIDGPRSRPVKAIVSARPQWAEGITREWLSRHGFKYNQLVLCPDHILDPVRQGEWKAQVLRSIKPMLYVDSSPGVAAVVASLCPVPVICPSVEGGYVAPSSRREAEARYILPSTFG